MGRLLLEHLSLLPRRYVPKDDSAAIKLFAIVIPIARSQNLAVRSEGQAGAVAEVALESRPHGAILQIPELDFAPLTLEGGKRLAVWRNGNMVNAFVMSAQSGPELSRFLRFGDEHGHLNDRRGDLAGLPRIK